MLEIPDWIKKINQWPEKKLSDLLGDKPFTVKPFAQYKPKHIGQKFTILYWRFVLEPSVHTGSKNGKVEVYRFISDISGTVKYRKGYLEWIPKPKLEYYEVSHD